MVERLSSVRQNVSTVCVGCNLPNGLELQLFAEQSGSEMTPQGPRAVKVFRKHGDPITLKGVAYPFGKMPEHQIISGYAVTMVPKEFWDKWCAQFHDHDALKNKSLIAAADLSDLQAKVREARQAKVRSGMEAIDPKNPPPVGGRVTPATTGNA